MVNFSVLRPSDILSYEKFFTMFGYKLNSDISINSKYITLCSYDGSPFDKRWLLKNYNNRDGRIDIPSLTVDYTHLRNKFNKYQLYGAYLECFIKCVQYTPLASHNFYDLIKVSDRNNVELTITFPIDNISTYFKIKSNLVNPSLYKFEKLYSINLAIYYRALLSQKKIRSILYNVYIQRTNEDDQEYIDNNAVIVYLHHERITNDFTLDKYNNIVKKILDKFPTDSDVLTCDSFKDMILSKLIEVKIINNNAYTHDSLLSLQKPEDPFTRIMIHQETFLSLGNSYRGYEDNHGILGVIKVNKHFNKNSINIEDGLVIVERQIPYITNFGVMLLSDNQEVVDTHRMIVYKIILNNSIINSHSISLIVSIIDIEKVRLLIQSLWNKGLFLGIWDLSYYIKYKQLPQCVKMVTVHNDCQSKSLERIDFWEKLNKL